MSKNVKHIAVKSDRRRWSSLKDTNVRIDSKMIKARLVTSVEIRKRQAIAYGSGQSQLIVP